MNKNKFLTFLLFGLILVILIELGIIFIGNSSSIQISSPSTISPAQTSNLNNPTSSLQSPTSNNASQSSASNLPYIPLVSRLDYIEGKVISWEDIPNSSDKYLTLNEEKTNKTIKARIIFDKEAITSPTKFATGFGKRKTKNLEFEILGPINSQK